MKYEELSIKQITNSSPTKEDIDLLRLKLKLRELKTRAKTYASMSSNDAALFASLDLCLDAPAKIPGEFEKVNKAIDKLKKDAPEDFKTGVRVDYLEFSKWSLEQLIRRSSKEAFRRKERLFKLLKSPAKQKEEMKKCADDIMYWFENYAWIVDPRNSLLYTFPFELFEFQKESVQWIDELIFTMRSDGLIDKSRDMGVTWLIVCMFVYYWLFPREGTKFEALITSYRADEVDKANVASTIFEKIRSQIRLLPSWMLPAEFDSKKHMTYMTVINPENKSTITGTTANAETGRSGRFTVIFFDEYASIEQDVSSYTASTQSANSRLFISTPKGKLNHFAQLRFAGDIPVRSFHWTKHPFKDARWYAGQKLRMSPEMVAQELDIDYDASQPGKVYPHYNEVYHVITKSDFMREIAGAIRIDDDGERHFRIPTDWNLGRAHDWGSSDSGGEHANITMWFATAKKGTTTRTHGIDISGSVFVYRMYTAPPHSTVRAVAKEVHKLQFPENEQARMIDELMSHEALSERDTYEQEHNLYYKAWDTDYNGGIAQVRDYLEVQYVHQPHPFRINRTTGAPFIKGRPNIYIVVDDNQGECYFDRYTNKWQVRPGSDDHGLARLRAEFGVYHYPKSEAGKPVRRQRPEKMFDDAMDCLRCMAITFPPIAQLSPQERMEAMLPKEYRTEEALKEHDMEERARLWFARNMYINENRLKERLASENQGLGRRDRVFKLARERANRR